MYPSQIGTLPHGILLNHKTLANLDEDDRRLMTESKNTEAHRSTVPAG